MNERLTRDLHYIVKDTPNGKYRIEDLRYPRGNGKYRVVSSNLTAKEVQRFLEFCLENSVIGKGKTKAKS